MTMSQGSSFSFGNLVFEKQASQSPQFSRKGKVATSDEGKGKNRDPEKVESEIDSLNTKLESLSRTVDQVLQQGRDAKQPSCNKGRQVQGLPPSLPKTEKTCESDSESEDGKQTKRKRQKRNHVFWAQRSTAISSDFVLKLTSQEAKEMLPDPERLGIRKAFRRPRSKPQVEPASNCSSQTRYQGTIFEDRDPTEPLSQNLIQTKLHFQSGQRETMPEPQELTSACFDVEPPSPKRSDSGNDSNEESKVDRKASNLAQQKPINPFESIVWQLVLERYPAVVETASIEKILHQNLGNATKVKELAVVISKIHYLEEGAMCIISDPSGEMQSEVHGYVLSSEEFDFCEGAAVVLKNVTVFRAHLNRKEYASHSVIITLKNIEQVFSPNVKAREQRLREKQSKERQKQDEEVVEWMASNAKENAAWNKCEKEVEQERVPTKIGAKESVNLAQVQSEEEKPPQTYENVTQATDPNDEKWLDNDDDDGLENLF